MRRVQQIADTGPARLAAAMPMCMAAGKSPHHAAPTLSHPQALQEAVGVAVRVLHDIDAFQASLTQQEVQQVGRTAAFLCRARLGQSTVGGAAVDAPRRRLGLTCVAPRKPVAASFP